MRRLALITLTCLCGVTLVGACGNAPAGVPTTQAGGLVPNAVVRSVTDGDTIVVSVDGVDERVRLIGIDTPETNKPDTPVQCFGPEATAFTRSLLPEGAPVHLQRDVEGRDGYGRLLAYVYRGEDGLFVNLEIIARGYARLLTYPPNVAHTSEFVAAAQAARAGNLGLWAGCSG